MTIRGIILDTVSSPSTFHVTEMNHSYPFNGAEVSGIYGSESATREALWRTITANTLRSGATLPLGIPQDTRPHSIKNVGLGNPQETK